METQVQSAARYYGGTADDVGNVEFKFTVDGKEETVRVPHRMNKRLMTFGSLNQLSLFFGKKETLDTVAASVIVKEYWTWFLRSVNAESESYGWTQRMFQSWPSWAFPYMLAEMFEKGCKSAVVEWAWVQAEKTVTELVSHYVSLYKKESEKVSVPDSK